MTGRQSRFKFASAPNSWGVLDYPSPSWEQSYQTMLDEMVFAGYTGTELGPYGFLPTDPKLLESELSPRKLKLLGSFVPVVLSDPASTKIVVEQIRIVGGTNLRTLVRGLNQIGLKPTGIIAILQAIKSAGALQADLVIQ